MQWFPSFQVVPDSYWFPFVSGLRFYPKSFFAFQTPTYTYVYLGNNIRLKSKINLRLKKVFNADWKGGKVSLD